MPDEKVKGERVWTIKRCTHTSSAYCPEYGTICELEDDRTLEDCEAVEIVEVIEKAHSLEQVASEFDKRARKWRENRQSDAKASTYEAAAKYVRSLTPGEPHA